jgi:hypothetical protein
MGKKKIKRASGPTKKYEEGSQAAVGEKLKKDYDKINFRNKAIDAFNNITDRKVSPAGRKRKSATPFSNISGLKGFNSRPQLGYKPAYKRKK